MPRTDAHNIPCVENETLITSSRGSRPARPSTLSPGPRPNPITPLHSAISDQYLPYTPDQHVLSIPDFLNQRPISHRPSLSPNPGHQISSPTVLESSTLSSLSTRHAAININSARPRTSNQVFNNISDLAAHYGIPQFLPATPRITPRRTTGIEEASLPQQTESFSSSSDFENLCSNYLNMLSQKPGDGSANVVSSEDTAPVAAATNVTDVEVIRSLMDVLNGSLCLATCFIQSDSPCCAATPELQMSNDLNEYLTSPLIDSPLDDDLLTTPAIGSDMHMDVMTSPLMGDFGNDPISEYPSLFSDFNDTMDQGSKSSQNEPFVVPHQPNFDRMYRLESPITPFIDSPSASPFNRKTAPLPSAKRKVTATGTRRNLTPESLVPIDAPTQMRKYLTPSTTSRKELPATWRRKRLRTAGPGDEEDQLVEEGLSPTMSEQEQIEAKRRQNTVAARRSRKRKLEYQRELEESLEQYKREGEMWKQRAMTCQALLRSHHIECPEFPES
ncbi:hypothetical protein J3R82DRAFT_9325 [Butyriboletus roseoflavus]|nr:hypothetical protein J3R82DRAFT_9325 [Butyriboletus roseoflavus]